MHYNIFVLKTSGSQELRGIASNFGDLTEMLSSDEMNNIIENGAYTNIKNAFFTKQIKSKESYICDIDGVSINAISDGFEINSLVFCL